MKTAEKVGVYKSFIGKNHPFNISVESFAVLILESLSVMKNTFLVGDCLLVMLHVIAWMVFTAAAGLGKQHFFLLKMSH